MAAGGRGATAANACDPVPGGGGEYPSLIPVGGGVYTSFDIFSAEFKRRFSPKYISVRVRVQPLHCNTQLWKFGEYSDANVRDDRTMDIHQKALLQIL
jgi:hypothetical protein